MAEMADSADPSANSPGWRPWTFGGLVAGLNAVGSLCIFALMILINADIFGRFAISSPLPGVKELVELSIVGIVFLQLPHTLRAGRITRSEAAFNQLLSRLPRCAHVMSALYNLTGVLLAALIVYGSVPRFASAWSDNHYIGNQGIFVAPVWPVRLIIVVGCTCLAVQFALFLWRDIRRIRECNNSAA
jgi:TRAP-type C4-dicarboxylate transport system permease small subunit